MNTSSRAEILAKIAKKFSIYLGDFTADDLLELVERELGHRSALDDFSPRGTILSVARPISPLIHVFSSNTPHAALQSLLRGLLLGTQNWCKLPAGDLPEFHAFCKELPPPLQAKVESDTTLRPEWCAQAKAAILYGSDESVSQIRRQLPREIPIIAHGHKVSIGLITSDPGKEAAFRAARDIGLFDQRGCLSLHDIYVVENSAGDALAFAEKLAHAMEDFEKESPRSTLSLEEEAQIIDLRSGYRFRAASDSRVDLWESQGDTSWTVIYEEEPQFATSCGNRFAFVKPWPSDPQQALENIAPHLSTVAIWPNTYHHATSAAQLGAPRICTLGEGQNPSLFWHNDGIAPLSPLVTWQDWEPLRS